MPQETQQKTFKFVKSSKGQINFRPPPQLELGRRGFLDSVAHSLTISMVVSKVLCLMYANPSQIPCYNFEITRRSHPVKFFD